MAGTKAGAKKAAATIKEKYGEDFYRKLGRKGGQNGRGEFYTGGFACLERGSDGLTGPERARILGAKWGRISKRGPAKNKRGKIVVEYLHAEQEDGIRVATI